ncbi:hypothetical protein ACHAQJ_001071 [Trichoderma viride]
MDSKPRSPRSWTWKCHQCRRRYPLACTRRCLDCSHTLCFPNGDNKQDAKSSCRVVFDLFGWQAYYQWRRELLDQNSSNQEPQTNAAVEISEEHSEMVEREDEEPEWLNKLLNDTHDCSIDCAFPSECFHKLRQLAQESGSWPSNTPSSSSEPRREKELKKPKKARKLKPRGRNSFQRQPSRLNPEWQAQRATQADDL